MVDESADAKSQTLFITVCLTHRYCYPIILDTFFVYFGQLVLLFLFLFFLLSLIIIIIIVSITYRGPLIGSWFGTNEAVVVVMMKKKKTHLVPPITFSLKQVCLDINLCIASPSEVTTIRNLSGLQDIISAMNCTCAPRERGSRRVSAEHVHFRGTKYETRVDVGQCIRCRVHGES